MCSTSLEECSLEVTGLKGCSQSFKGGRAQLGPLTALIGYLNVLLEYFDFFNFLLAGNLRGFPGNPLWHAPGKGPFLNRCLYYLGYYGNTFVNPWFVNTFVVRDILHKHTLILMILKTSKTVTSIDVLPSKNQALCKYCTLASKLKHC